MRFPDLLVEVKSIHDLVRGQERILGHLLSRIQLVEKALVAAYPPARDLLVSREADLKEDDRGTDQATLF